MHMHFKLRERPIWPPKQISYALKLISIECCSEVLGSWRCMGYLRGSFSPIGRWPKRSYTGRRVSFSATAPCAHIGIEQSTLNS